MKSRRSFESSLGAILLITAPVLCGASTPERIVVVLGQNDPAVSARVLRELAGCTERVPTAVVSAFDRLRIQQDFAGAGGGGFTLAPQLLPERIEKARSLPASLRLLADALGPLASRTTIVLVDPRVGVVWSGAAPSNAERSPGNRSTDVEPVSAGEAGFLSPAEIPQSVYEARTALRKAGVALVALDTSGRYDAGAKALTEFPKGRYLAFGKDDFRGRLVNAVCAAAP
jgi:hypothetical protein